MESFRNSVRRLSIALLMRTLIVLFLCSVSALGQNTPRTKIRFLCTCEDEIGLRYATAFRDMLATSPRYVETQVAEESIAGSDRMTSNWVVHVISLDASLGEPNGAESAMAVILTQGGVYYLDLVKTCGRNAAQNCAEQTLARVDEFISNHH